MKKINIIFFILLTMIGLNSCSDQMGVKINPTAESGTLRFHLNQPVYSNYVLTDANSQLDMDSITCVEPNYGFTAAVNYTTQVCFDSTFTAGTFQSLPTTVNGQKVGVNTLEMDKAIIALYPGGVLPTPVVRKNVFVRLMAIVSTTVTNPMDSLHAVTVKPLYSNAVMLKILPYVLPLFAYIDVPALRFWYIIGLGDGAWHNDKAYIGSSIYPLSIEPGKKYNLKGDGEYTFTGYFAAARQFKIIGPDLKWDGTQWGMNGSTYAQNGANNIAVPADGYYTITLNSIDNTLKIVPAVAPLPKIFASMGLTGAMPETNWASLPDLVMKPSETTNNHVWYINYTFSADYQCKIRANSAWDDNWGTPSANDGDPIYTTYAIGVKGGKNILGKTGSYTIVLNDVDGCYFFFKK